MASPQNTCITLYFMLLRASSLRNKNETAVEIRHFQISMNVLLGCLRLSRQASLQVTWHYLYVSGFQNRAAHTKTQGKKTTYQKKSLQSLIFYCDATICLSVEDIELALNVNHWANIISRWSSVTPRVKWRAGLSTGEWLHLKVWEITTHKHSLKQNFPLGKLDICYAIALKVLKI